MLLVGGALRRHRRARDRGRGMREVSIGDYVLSGGELAAMVLIDACVRLLPGVLGAAGSLERGKLRGGPVGIPALHQAARMGGPRDPRGAAVRRPQEDRRVAPRREAERLTRRAPPRLWPARNPKGRKALSPVICCPSRKSRKEHIDKAVRFGYDRRNSPMLAVAGCRPVVPSRHGALLCFKVPHEHHPRARARADEPPSR